MRDFNFPVTIGSEEALELAKEHLDAARSHLSEWMVSPEGSQVGEKHYARAMDHLGRYNGMLRAQLRPNDLRPMHAGYHGQEHKPFLAHEADSLLKIRDVREFEPLGGWW